MLPSYPKKIRERAKELFLENPSMSYNDIAQKLHEEFPDELPRPPNKTTIRNWVIKLRDKKYEHPKEINKEIPDKKETEQSIEKVTISDDVPEELKELPKISPPEIAGMLAEKSTIVEERVNIDDIEEVVDEPEEKKESLLSRISGNKLILVAGAVTIVGVIIFLILRRKHEPPQNTGYSEQPPVPKEEKSTKRVVEL